MHYKEHRAHAVHTWLALEMLVLVVDSLPGLLVAPPRWPEQLELAALAAEHLSPPSEISIYEKKPFQQHRAALEPCLRICKKCKILAIF